jgi:hypothetical protein
MSFFLISEAFDFKLQNLDNKAINTGWRVTCPRLKREGYPIPTTRVHRLLTGLSGCETVPFQTDYSRSLLRGFFKRKQIRSRLMDRQFIWQFMKNFLLIILLLFQIFTIQVAAQEKDCGQIAENIGHGGIVWTENAIVVQGTAAPDLSDPSLSISTIKRRAKAAAKLDAYRKAAGVLTGVKITSVEKAAHKHRVETKINAFVRQARICKTKFFADGGVDIVVVLPISGAIAMGLLDDAGSNVAKAPSDYSAVVIDARELAFEPAVVPRLLAPGGSLLFDQKNIKREIILSRGAVTYVATPEAVTLDLAGNHPLMASGVGLGSNSPSDLVVDAEAARILEGSPDFIGNGKIVIITSGGKKIACQNSGHSVENQRIDWGNRIVLARGFGKVDFTRELDNSVRMRMMERAAEVDAHRRLLEACLKIKVDHRRSLRDIPGSIQNITGTIMNAVRCHAKYFKDGTAEVVLAAPIDSMVAKSIEMGTLNKIATDVKISDITGIIIDATGLGFEPSLMPRILNRNGSEIYGSGSIAKAYARQYGIAGYSRTMAAAGADKRSGKSPIMVKAVGLGIQNSTALVISSQDSKKFQQLNGILSRGRVVIVTEDSES